MFLYQFYDISCKVSKFKTQVNQESNCKATKIKAYQKYKFNTPTFSSIRFCSIFRVTSHGKVFHATNLLLMNLGISCSHFLLLLFHVELVKLILKLFNAWFEFWLRKLLALFEFKQATIKRKLLININKKMKVIQYLVYYSLKMVHHRILR